MSSDRNEDKKTTVKPRQFRVFANLPKIPEEQFSLLRYYGGVGGAPKFDELDSIHQFLETAKKLNHLFDQEGNIQIRDYEYAEEYALCLVNEGKFAAAKTFFDLITGNSSDILKINNPPKNGSYISDETANEKGKLGYCGLSAYILVCHKLEEIQKAISLKKEFISKVPTKCAPGYLFDVRFGAISGLIKEGVIKVGEIDLTQELIKAKHYEY